MTGSNHGADFDQCRKTRWSHFIIFMPLMQLFLSEYFQDTTFQSGSSATASAKYWRQMRRNCLKSDTHPVKQRHRVKQKGKHERSGPQKFTPLWEPLLQEPADKSGRRNGKMADAANCRGSSENLRLDGEIYRDGSASPSHWNGCGRDFHGPSPRVAGQTGAE